MFCSNCGAKMPDGTQFCPNCGVKAVVEKEPAFNPVPPVQPTPQPVIVQQAPITRDTLPAQFRPLSAWAYFGYSLLFSIPIVGFVFLIVFSFNGSNINRRSFARSYWCALLLVVIIVCVILLIAALTGGVAALYDRLEAMF